MRAFIHQFQSRYQGSTVPLLQALDEESGVGFDDDGDWQSGASPLLAGIPFARPASTTVDWNARVAWLFDRLAAVLRTGKSELALSDADIEALSTEQPPPMPTGVGVLATIAASSSEAVERGEYRIYLRKAFGPNSAKLLGRFCQTDPELYRHVLSALKREEACDPEAVHAEVVHIPHYRAANAICRPVLRDYEIPLFDRSGAPPARVISLQDLLVSVESDRVVLRSQRLGRRVVPHLTCAHAFRKSSVGLYRFLASLEEQGTWSELAFSWGPLASAPYLPRVVHERCVFALAQWTISSSELRRIARLSAAPRFGALQELRARLQLPRFVVLADADNALPIDFDNALSLQSFMKTAERSSRVCTERGVSAATRARRARRRRPIPARARHPIRARERSHDNNRQRVPCIESSDVRHEGQESSRKPLVVCEGLLWSSRGRPCARRYCCAVCRCTASSPGDRPLVFRPLR